MKEKEQIIDYILKKIDSDDENIVEKVLNNFDIKKSTVYNYLKELEERMIVKKNAKTYCKYSLVTKNYKPIVLENNNLDEAIVYEKYIYSLLKNKNTNVERIWGYAFTEMLNNAIDHSNAKRIVIFVSENYVRMNIAIIDDGIGIFNNIISYVKKTEGIDITIKEAADRLLAGKFTTNRKKHTGEGIFFSSHAMDYFRILSEGGVFTRNIEKNSDTFFSVKGIKEMEVGTMVQMSLANNCKKTLREVFDLYSGVDEGFFKTNIPLAIMFPTHYPISRSEAKRVCEMILNFTEVDLDFKAIEEIGQGFAHELFVIFKTNNPNIKINIKNACENVDFMIKRVINTK